MGYSVKDKIDDDIRLVQERKKIKKGGIYFERQLYQSEAFLSLSKSAMKFVIALLDARKREPVGKADSRKGKSRKFINLKNLEVTYGVLEKVYKIPRSSITRAIDEAMAKGFCKISHHGGAYQHDKSQYEWSDNYLLGRPEAEPFAIRQKDLAHRGYQGKRISSSKNVISLSANETKLDYEKNKTSAQK